MRAEEQGEMSAGYLSAEGRSTFGFVPLQLFKFIHKLLQILPFPGNYIKVILSDGTVLAAEFKPVKYHRPLQISTKLKLDCLVAR